MNYRITTGEQTLQENRLEDTTRETKHGTKGTPQIHHENRPTD